MTEKEQAELEEKKANAEKIKMETYQGYVDMGIMEPYMVEKLEFGNTLKEIEAPEDEKLPPVQEINNPPAKKTKEEQDEPIPEIPNKNNKTAKQNKKK